MALYNLLIYLPLLVICICARSILPELKVSDEVMPRLALWATRDLPGGSLVSGLILAAPLGAVMSTISAYLVVIASSLVRDVYQHFFRPAASQAEVRRVAQGVMIVLGLVAVAASIRPVDYLQTLIVFSAAACGATFFVPAWMLAYWPRATAAGTGAAMLAGAGTILGLLVTGLVLARDGWHQPIDHESAFASYYPWRLSSADLCLGGVVGRGCRGQPASRSLRRGPSWPSSFSRRWQLPTRFRRRRQRDDSQHAARCDSAGEPDAANSLLPANFRIFTTSA